jgi:hypothetical protein
MYSKINTYLQEDEFVNPWPELMDFIISIINEKPKHILMPGVIAAAYGGNEASQVGANSVITLLYAAIIAVDSILDGDEFGPVAGFSSGELANMSLGLAGWAVRVLDRLDAARGKSEASDIFSRLLYQVSLGQALDSGNPETEDAYWELARMKSGSFFSGAFTLGGLAGGASAADQTRLAALGQVYGVMLQIHDDLRDALETPANPDWLNGRYTLPILYAHLVDHPERARFDAIRPKVADEAFLVEAQEILVRSGALSYGFYQIQELYDQAMLELEDLSLADDQVIHKMFNELQHPVEKILARVAA